jgi:hypothetical protein
MEREEEEFLVNYLETGIRNEETGKRTYCDKKYYGVKFPEFLNKGKKSNMPQVTKRLIHDSFFASVKTPEPAPGWGGGG